MRAAGREQLMAARSYLDHWITKLDEKAGAQPRPSEKRSRSSSNRRDGPDRRHRRGAWGTTLAIMLAAAERPVTIWAHSQERNEELAQARENRRYLPDASFPTEHPCRDR